MADHDDYPDVYRPQIGDTEALIANLRNKVDTAGTLPLSSSPRIAREEVLADLDAALDALPLELKEARWLLKEREDVLVRARKEGDELIEAARDRAARMVEKTEVVREARRTAEHIVREADDRARAMRLETEDYVDQKLAAFEVVLDRTMQAVHKGREKLQVHVGTPVLAEAVEVEATAAENAFFDQDEL